MTMVNMNEPKWLTAMRKNFITSPSQNDIKLNDLLVGTGISDPASAGIKIDLPKIGGITAMTPTSPQTGLQTARENISGFFPNVNLGTGEGGAFEPAGRNIGKAVEAIKTYSKAIPTTEQVLTGQPANQPNITTSPKTPEEIAAASHVNIIATPPLTASTSTNIAGEVIPQTISSVLRPEDIRADLKTGGQFLKQTGIVETGAGGEPVFTNKSLSMLYGMPVSAPMTDKERMAQAADIEKRRDETIATYDRTLAGQREKELSDIVIRAGNQPTPANIAAANIAQEALGIKPTEKPLTYEQQLGIVKAGHPPKEPESKFGIAYRKDEMGQQFPVIYDTKTGKIVSNAYEENELSAPESVKAPPKIGDIVKGYKFKGGNPADKNSWEKA